MMSNIDHGDKDRGEPSAATYVSALMGQAVVNARARGQDVIDLSIGNPDLPPPQLAIDLLREMISNAESHRYAPMESQGVPALRKAVAAMYHRRFGVMLDPTEEVQILLGAKEAAHYLCMTHVGPGDVVLVCEPAYSTYRAGAMRFGAEVYPLHGSIEQKFVPDPLAIPADVLSRTKLAFVNFPNNPTGATATLETFEQWVALARQNRFLICNDNVYSEIYEGDAPHSLLEVPGATEVAVEIHSISKTYNLCGWRVGMMSGKRDVLKKVLEAKRFCDAGPATVQQLAAASLLVEPLTDFFHEQREQYASRRRLFTEGLSAAGYEVFNGVAGMFVWARTPGNEPAVEHVRMLLDRHAIACNPGTAYGSVYDHYVRFSLGVPDERLIEAVRRITSHTWSSTQ